MPRMWDLEDLASSSEIANTLGVNKSTVSMWKRRYPDFPAPLIVLNGITVYSWAQVRDWYNSHDWDPNRGGHFTRYKRR